MLLTGRHRIKLALVAALALVALANESGWVRAWLEPEPVRREERSARERVVVQARADLARIISERSEARPDEMQALAELEVEAREAVAAAERALEDSPGGSRR